MAGGVFTIAAGILDAAGTPAVSKVSANQRVTTTTGAISLQSDVLQFNGVTSTTGHFLVAMQRVTIMGIPAVHALSTAQAISTSSGAPLPCVIVMTDPRVSGS